MGTPRSRTTATATPPRAVPSSLVRTRPLTPPGLRELATLDEAVAPDGGVEDEEGLVGGAGDLAVGHPGHLRELRHQVRAGVEAPGGVHEDRVVPPGDRRPQGVGEDRRRIGALGAPVKARPRPAPPTPRAARRPRRERCRRRTGGPSGPLAFQLAASLPMVVVFPVPLTPTTKTTHGFAENGARGGGHLEGALDLLPERGAHRRAARPRRSRRCGPRSTSRASRTAGRPMSAARRASSTDSRAAASRGRRPRTRSSRGMVSTSRVRERPPRRRSTRLTRSPRRAASSPPARAGRRRRPARSGPRKRAT